MKSTVKSYFYTGLISLLPIVITISILEWIFNFILGIISNSFIAVLLKKILEYTVPAFVTNASVEMLLNISTNTLTIIIILIFVIFMGYTLQHVFLSKFVVFINKIFMRAPLVGQVYSTIKQIVEIFSKDRTKSYQKVVIVEYPRKGIYSMGFMTSTTNSVFEKRLSTEKMCNIFIPTSPNPTSGMFIVMPEENVHILDIKVDDAIKLIISAGVIVPGENRGEKNE